MSRRMTFQQAVSLTPDIRLCYKEGLLALGPYSRKISTDQHSKLQGSVNIDNCTNGIYPNENRWDFAIAFDSEVFFIEVHSASPGEVKIMLRKLMWLKDWLRVKAPEVNRLKAKKDAIIWIQSKRFDIPKHTPQYRLAKSNGILPVKTLVLK